MGYAPSHNDRERVLDATDIVDVVGDHLALKRKGREFVGLCPFHDDTKPSMYVVPHKQIFHCFACGAGGNAFDFMMKFHGMDFRATLEQLAERAGIELTKPNTPRHAHAESDVSRDDIAKANALALRLFRTLLAHPEHGEAARQAIAKRGIDDDTAEAFMLGVAPDRWDGLIAMANKSGIPIAHLEAAGLVKTRKESSGHYDTFRHRLIFPILDQLGRPIAFGGRKLREDDDPKYLNSPESPLFDKSSTLYALKQATLAIKQADQAIVCEGYTDVIACHQAGVQNAIATLGTAFTPNHAKIVRRVCSSVVLLFDGDEAGLKAAERAVEVCFAEPIDVRVAMLPKGQDPDDLLSADGGRAAFDTLIASAVDAIEFRYARLDQSLREAGHATGSAARTRAVEEDAQRIAQMGLARISPIRRETIIDRLARIAGVDRRAIIEAVTAAQSRTRQPATTTAAPGAAPPALLRRADEAAVACLLADPSLATRDGAGVDDALLAMSAREGIWTSLASAIATAIEDEGADGLARFESRLPDADLRQLASGLVSWAERITERDALADRWPERIQAMWNDCVRRLRLDGADNTPALDNPAARLASLRERHATLGGHAVPRPLAGRPLAPATPIHDRATPEADPR